MVVVALIHIYFVLMYVFNLNKNDDPLMKIRSPILSNYLNGWCISHFIFFTFIGYNYGGCLKEAMLGGVLWEVYEFAFGEIFPIVFPKIAKDVDPLWSTWYYGCYEDVVMNFLGFMFGKYLKKWFK